MTASTPPSHHCWLTLFVTPNNLSSLKENAPVSSLVDSKKWFCWGFYKWAPLQLEIIGPVYSQFVYDRNRPLAPILGLRRCSLMYDVYWLARWLLILWGSKYLEHILGSELNIFWVTWILNNKVESNKKHCIE